jgi:E3 ubiquitin-protein ligase UBR4
LQSHASDLFEAYPLLVTEMVLRLTYQVKKIADGSGEDSEMKDLSEDWFTCLFEVNIAKILRETDKRTIT